MLLASVAMTNATDHGCRPEVSEGAPRYATRSGERTTSKWARIPLWAGVLCLAIALDLIGRNHCG
jgi:hypothetical protein